MLGIPIEVIAVALSIMGMVAVIYGSLKLADRRWSSLLWFAIGFSIFAVAIYSVWSDVRHLKGDQRNQPQAGSSDPLANPKRNGNGQHSGSD